MDKTLLKGLAILEIIAKSEEGSKSITDLANATGLPRSNVHRVLQTLAHAGYLTQNPETGLYEGNTRLFELGVQQLSRLNVRNIAPSYMRMLVEQTGETTHLSILQGIDVVYIDEVPGPHPVRTHTVVGDRAPAYAVATGKALLSQQPREYLQAFEGSFKSHTKSTLASIRALSKDLDKCLRQGYAINRGEWRESVAGIAAPIFNRNGQAVAAIGISAPLERLTTSTAAKIGPIVKDAAMAISVRLGYRNELIQSEFGASSTR
jgi:IclR family transcriptional regulator, KDG regulon repressor